MKSTIPLVSVIMTSYNEEKFISSAIKSLLDQSYVNFELLIADDCSTDSTKEKIAKFKDPRIKCYHNEKNLHYMETRNKLFKQVKGEFITLLDADDIALPDRIEKLLSEFKKDPELGMCGSYLKHVDIKGNFLKIKEYPTSYEVIKKQILKSNPFCGSAVMVKTSIVKEMNGYRHFFNKIGNEDYDLYSRIIEKYKAINIPEPLYVYRQYPTSTSRINIGNAYKKNGNKIVQFLIQERLSGSKDSIERGDMDKIDALVYKLEEPYRNDPSLFDREMAAIFLSDKFYILALKSSLAAIFKKPLKLLNYRTFFYCLRVSIINILN